MRTGTEVPVDEFTTPLVHNLLIHNQGSRFDVVR